MGRTTPELSPGTRLGKYEIIRPLALGGMAELFLARAHGIEGFQKQVVLKRVLPQFVGDERFVGMFLDEARLAANLHHPNVAQVYDIGESDGSYYFTMEYVDGHSLLEILRTEDWPDNGMPLSPALNILVGLTAGLHYAHEKVDADGKPLSIVHRDVSPSNVLVSFDGGVKLVDFGIAKATSQRTATGEHTFKGKLRYMSPEQLSRGPIDRRSDVFSAGILLYEMTTGLRLFDSENPAVIIHKLGECEFAPPSHVKTDYPARLEGIVMRALAKNPDERYASALNMQLALSEFALDEKIMISPVVLSAYVAGLFRDRPVPSSAPDPVGSQEHVRLVSSPHPTVGGGPTPAPEALFTRPGAVVGAPIRSTRHGRRGVVVALALALAFFGVRFGIRQLAPPRPQTEAPVNQIVEWIVFDDIQGLYGGRAVYWQPGQDAVVINVTANETGLSETRFTVELGDDKIAALATLLAKARYAKMAVTDRPGIPDEVRTKIRVHWRSGLAHTVEKWSGVTHPDFSTVATWLRNLGESPSKQITHEGKYEVGFAPAGPWQSDN